MTNQREILTTPSLPTEKNHRVSLGTFRASPSAFRYIQQVLESGRLSYGPFLRQFEQKFAALHDCQFGLSSNSGTSSLQVGLQALKELHGWQDGDEVLVPSSTFVATANIVLHCRMTPRFVDVDPLYYEMDPKLLESKITSRTRALIPVHLFGQPCDMKPIQEIARQHNLKIIEDSCQTMFASYNGKSCGSLGDIACFSTYVAHLIVTGVGGLNTTNNPDYARKIRSLLNHGRDNIYLSIDDDDGKTAQEMEQIVAKRFHFVSLGHSYRVTEMEGALGLAALENWEEMIQKRKANAEFISSQLETLKDRIQLPAIRPESTHSFMMYPIVLKDQKKEALVNHLENHGVETRDLFPLISQPVYQQLYKIEEKEFPVAQWLRSSGLYFGCHQDLEKSDLLYVTELIRQFFKA